MYSTWKQTVINKEGKEVEVTGFHGTGNLTKDSELKTTKNGKFVASGASLAINGFKNGEKVTEFFRLEAWDKTAENFSKFGSKGRTVEVKGTLIVRENEGKDGKTYRNEIVNIQAFNFLSGGQRSESSAPVEDAGYNDMTPIDDSDIPF